MEDDFSNLNKSIPAYILQSAFLKPQCGALRVGECCVLLRSYIVRCGGAYTSTDAGLSSESSVKNRASEYQRFPPQRFSTEG